MTKAKYCSFCGKSEDEVLVLIAGPGSIFICDEDVDLCGDVVAKHRAGKGGVDGRPFSEFRAEVLAKVAPSHTPTEAELGELTRDERLDYERRILAAEIEWNRLARKALPFLALIERNTPEIDDAFIVANAVHERRGLDRLTAEPWMPTLLDLRATILGHDLLSQQLADEYGDCDEAEPGEAEVERLDRIEESLSRQVDVLFDKGLREEGLLVSQASSAVGAAIAALRSTTPAVAVDDDALVERLRVTADKLDSVFDKDMSAQLCLREAADRLQSLLASVRVKDEALQPFADCIDQIADSEDDEEWAKFRLLIKDYRRAAAAFGPRSPKHGDKG